MSKQMITDELFDLVLKRHRKEKPEVKMNNNQMNGIWFSLYNKVRTEGSSAARQYAITMKL